MRGAASWALAALAALALVVGVALLYAGRTVFSADGFAERAQATLDARAVRADIARRVSDAAIRAEPDLVAVRPLLETATGAIVGTDAFRAIVGAAARDAHRSAFDRDANTVALRLGDAGILVAEALRRLRPDVARRLPERFETRLLAVTSGNDRTALRLAQRAQDVRRGTLVAFVVAALLAAGALAAAPSRRAGTERLGLAVAVAGGLLALVVAAGPRALADGAAGRAVVRVWLGPLTTWAAVLAAAGAVVALAAASLLRPVPVGALLRRAALAVAAPPRGAAGAAVRALAAVGLGVVAILEPRRVAEIAVAVAGVVLAVWGLSELMRLSAAPARAPRGPRRIGRRGGLRLAGVAVLALAALGAAGALAAGGSPEGRRVGRCNGSAALCDRRLDDVAFVGTHNSMAADREPGWLFAAQDAGIPAQLGDGVRALLVDTHYGFAKPRGVLTDLSGDTKSRAKLVDEVGDRFVETAERLRNRIGPPGDAPREVFLCHAFCEVGATRALDAFTAVHRFLVTHAEEVLVLSIEDDTSAADTAAVLERSGLAEDAYRGPARPPWPTLRTLIDRNERVLVLTENREGARPWIHRQPPVMQETPYRFRTPAALAAPASCAPNRGGTRGSLLLVNHWVDTSPAPRPGLAREVNARAFLDERLARCRRERRLLPTVVAVDFYREGDVAGAVAKLNGLP